MERTLLKALFFQILLGVSIGCEYERLGRHHTMCIYRAQACPNSQLLRSGGISAADKNLIVKIHNRVRSDLALGNVRGLPAAADMRVMTWDNELARIAQRWADQCTFGHDQLRNTEKGSVGQNVALYWSYGHKDPVRKDKPDWESSINLWSKEYGEFGFPGSHISPFVFKDSVGHYTQMVWAETHRIGCGFTYYKHPHKGYTKLYVCNYYPGGNVVGGTMYTVFPKGATCSDPSLAFSKDYRGLCEKRRNYRVKRRNSERKRMHSHTRKENSRTFKFSSKQKIRKTRRMGSLSIYKHNYVPQ